MSATHVFVASGDSCPLCLALAGTPVEAGYEAHPGCTCNTVLMDDGESRCEFDYEEGDAWWAGSRVRIHLDLTVTCPDGSVHSVPGADIDLGELRAGDMDEWLEMVAHDACDDACEAEEEEFLCC